MKYFNLRITKNQSIDLLKTLEKTDCDKVILNQLIKISEDTRSSKINDGIDIKDNTRKNSKNHNIIKEIHLACFPNNSIVQNYYIELQVFGKKSRCEFDIVDHTLKLIIEINGEQHYKFVPYFHKSKSDFTMQQVRDEEKKNWAILNGYTFIAISEKDVLKLDKFFKINKNEVINKWMLLINKSIVDCIEYKKILEES